MAEHETQAGAVAELVVQIYAIHEAVIEESGGLAGLRDGAMLHEKISAASKMRRFSPKLSPR